MCSLASITAAGNSQPSASPAVIAAEYVQPVPCRCAPLTKGAPSNNSVLPS